MASGYTGGGESGGGGGGVLVGGGGGGLLSSGKKGARQRRWGYLSGIFGSRQGLPPYKRYGEAKRAGFVDTRKQFKAATATPEGRLALWTRVAAAHYGPRLLDPRSGTSRKFLEKYKRGTLLSGDRGRIPGLDALIRLSPAIRALIDAGGIPQKAPAGSPARKAANRIRELARRAQRRIPAAQALPGPDPVPLPGPPTLPNGEPEPAWLELLRLVAEQIQAYRDQKETQRLERAQRRALEMGLADSFGQVLGAVVNSAPAALQTYYGARAQDAAVKNQLRLARLGMPGLSNNYSGVPLSPGALAGGALGLLLGEEPGTMESGGMLENLGLEGDVERTVTLWKRSRGGFRANPEFGAVNPTSGAISVWRNMGRPVLYSGDLAACKRVNKISGRVGRVARRPGYAAARRRGSVRRRR